MCMCRSLCVRSVHVLNNPGVFSGLRGESLRCKSLDVGLEVLSENSRVGPYVLFEIQGT